MGGCYVALTVASNVSTSVMCMCVCVCVCVCVYLLHGGPVLDDDTFSKEHARKGRAGRQLDI